MPKNPPGSGFIVLRVESTPNPDARKFYLNRPVSDATISARSSSEAAGHTLMAALFTVPGITGVMLLHDFITINKSQDATWPDIKIAVRQILQSQ